MIKLIIFFKFQLAKFNRNSNQSQSLSIMSEISFLRYASSFISIVCCLILPITVEWTASSGGGGSVKHTNIINTNANLTWPVNLNQTNQESKISYHYFEINVLLYHIAILSCSSFIQIYFYFKLLMMIIGISIYWIGFQIQNSYQIVAESLNTPELFLFTELFVQLFFFVLFLHLIDRRVSSEIVIFV